MRPPSPYNFMRGGLLFLPRMETGDANMIYFIDEQK